jgi:phosphonate transport system permease protein
MGHYLRESVQRVESQEVAAIVLSIIVIVFVAEMLSAWIRSLISRATA